MPLPETDTLTLDTYNPLDGMAPGSRLEPEDLADTQVELDDDGLQVDDASDDDSDASGDTSEGIPDRSVVSRATSDASYDDPNSPEMRLQRVREREVAERIDQEYRSTAAQMAAEAERFEAERERIKAQYQNVEGQIGMVKAKLAEAIDDGDTRAQLDLNSALQELNQAKSQLAGHYNTVPTRDVVAQRYNDYWGQRRAELAAQLSSGMPEPMNETARSWQKTNRWMGDPQYKGAINDLYRINSDLVKEGFDASHDSFYKELASRLAKAHPNLPLRDKDGKALTKAAQRMPQSRNQGPPVASARSVSTTQQRSIMKNAKGKPVVVLDAADKAIIRSMGRDPNDKTVQRYYAQSKFERLRDEQLMKRVR